MSASATWHVLARYEGWCAGCSAERPLALVEAGPRGVRAWLAGIGPEDRALSYCCLVCGRDEHVPLTEAEDVEHDARLPRWSDAFVPSAPAKVPELPQPRPVVRVLQLPVDPVSPTWSRALALTG